MTILDDPYLEWKLNEGAEHCPSCAGLAGQVHLESTWQAMGLFPGSPRLFCSKLEDNCRCVFKTAEGTDQGTLVDVPYVIETDRLPWYDKEKRRQAEQTEEEDLAEGSMDKEQRITLSASGHVTEAGKFEVIAITAGDGNGWQFGEAVLRESLSLWDGATCFVDHGSWFGGRSVKDIAGVFNNPRWAEELKGVALELTTMGPSGELVDELGRQILSRRDQAAEVECFSADVIFTAKGREVQKIMRVLEVCLVYNPARGGAFVRALNSTFPRGAWERENTGGVRMADTQQTAPAVNENTNPPGGGLAAQLQEDVEQVRNFLAVQEERAKLAQEAEAARSVRLQMCAYLLDSGLAAARLPAAMAEHVRSQFAGKLFEPAELTMRSIRRASWCLT
jgi:hypothetical protein